MSSSLETSYYSYCGTCGAKLKKQSDTLYSCQNHHIMYNNPRATTGLLILNNDHTKILLAKRGFEPKKGQYDTIGGFVDYNEDPIEAAKREAREEIGLEVEIIHLLGCYTDYYVADISTTAIMYVAHIKDGIPAPSDDVESVSWFNLSQLPPASTYSWKVMETWFSDLRSWLSTPKSSS